MRECSRLFPIGVCLAFLAACQGGGPPAPLIDRMPAPDLLSSGAVGNVTVARGDTLYSISRRYNVSLRALIDANRLAPPYRLFPGQALSLPVTAEHVVAKGDNLTAIARRYGVDVSALVRLNGVAPPYTIFPGQRLRLPAVMAAMRADSPAGPAVAPTAPRDEKIVIVSPLNTRTGQSPQGAPKAASRAVEHATVSTPAPAAPPAARLVPKADQPDANPPPLHAAGFLWPVRGEVIGHFGAIGKGQHNDGINIAVPRGAPVRASEGGVVVYAGSELRGFGNMLLIKHADGWMTAYAHNEALLVARGDVVERGQVVARAGNTGNVVEPQLHFEVRRRTRAVDPLRHLRDDAVLLRPAAARGAPPSPG